MGVITYPWVWILVKLISGHKGSLRLPAFKLWGSHYKKNSIFFFLYHIFALTFCLFKPVMMKLKLISPYLSSGKTYLWSQKEEPGIGEVQVCVGLQDQGAEEADRAAWEWHQGHEGTDPGGSCHIMQLPALMMTCCHLNPQEQILINFESRSKNISLEKSHWKMLFSKQVTVYSGLHIATPWFWVRSHEKLLNMTFLSSTLWN